MSSRDARQRLLDIHAALDAIAEHGQRGDLSDGLIFDAVRVRLIEIGEAVKTLPRRLLDSEPELPWSEIARMRDLLAHRYFDTTHAIVASTVANDLPQLRRAVDRLLSSVEPDLGPGESRHVGHVGELAVPLRAATPRTRSRAVRGCC